MSAKSHGSTADHSGNPQLAAVKEIVDSDLSGLRKRMVPAISDNNNTDKSGVLINFNKETPARMDLIDIRQTTEGNKSTESHGDAEGDENFNESDLLLAQENLNVESALVSDVAKLTGISKGAGLVNEAFVQEMAEFKVSGNDLSSSAEEFSTSEVVVIPETSCSIAAQVRSFFLVSSSLSYDLRFLGVFAFFNCWVRYCFRWIGVG